jgi:Protein of unknown function (DUF3419)
MSLSRSGVANYGHRRAVQHLRQLHRAERIISGSCAYPLGFDDRLRAEGRTSGGNSLWWRYGFHGEEGRLPMRPRLCRICTSRGDRVADRVDGLVLEARASTFRCWENRGRLLPQSSMSDRIEERARFDLVRYANVWEDAETMRAALAPAPGKRMLSIASAGDNAFVLLAAGAEVVAADLSPAQLALVELKRAAIRRLGYEETLAFLGVRQGEDRRSVYELLEHDLSPRAQGVRSAAAQNLAGIWYAETRSQTWAKDQRPASSTCNTLSIRRVRRPPSFFPLASLRSSWKISRI